MDALSFLAEIVAAYPALTFPLTCLGTLVVMAQIILPLTPTKKDDAVLEKMHSGIPGKILKAVTSFAPIQKK